MMVQRTINGAGVKPAKWRGAEGGRRKQGQVGCSERDRAVCTGVCSLHKADSGSLRGDERSRLPKIVTSNQCYSSWLLLPGRSGCEAGDGRV